MLSFQHIQKTDIPLLDRVYQSDTAVGCEYNAASAFLWSREYDLRIAVFDDTVIKAYFRGDGSVWGYCMPHGQDVRGAVEAVLDYAKSRGEAPAFDYLSRQERDELEELFPNVFSYTPQQDTRDYIYSAEALATLEGKKFHSKRNHIARFFRNYPEAYIEPIDEETIPDALKVVRCWYTERGIDFENNGEYGVIRDAMVYQNEFKMRGAVLYADDQPVAMTLGCPISPLCFDVMFEKALRDFDGSYAVINNEFAKMLTSYRYLNREEDMGIEGLRKAKLSYHPEIIYERFRAEYTP